MRHRRLWLFVAGLEALMVLAAVYFEPSYRVRGTLWGEAFYDGKPTSWWRQELDRWDASSPGPFTGPSRGPRFRIVFYDRKSTWFEQQRERWFRSTSKEIVLPEWLLGPKILNDGEDAAPVLRALVDDPSPRVRRMARIGLGMKSDLDGEDR